MSTGNPPPNPNLPQDISSILTEWVQKFGSNDVGTGGAASVYPGHMTIGTCSCCGGPVTVPQVWGGVIPPVPTCARCGATQTQNFGPIIPMTPRWNPGGSYGAAGSSTDPEPKDF